MSSSTLNPSEISELIKSRIEQFKLGAEARNEGTIISVSDGIVRIHGLADAMQGEMIELPGNTFALAGSASTSSSSISGSSASASADGRSSSDNTVCSTSAGFTATALCGACSGAANTESELGSSRVSDVMAPSTLADARAAAASAAPAPICASATNGTEGAAGENADVRRYNAGHDLESGDAHADRVGWVKNILGLDGSK